jgi:endonuclease/exonuclease/phosphatase (EEP) superfamily protein YafD
LNHSFNVRNLQHAVIELPGKTELHVLNHHGHHVNQHKNGDDETMRQCGIIADKIKQLDEKIVLAGDFNLAPHSESIQQINNLLTNLSIKAKLETTRTQLTHKTEVCDYIFVSNEVEVRSFKALDDIVSDHKALVMEFE